MILRVVVFYVLTWVFTVLIGGLQQQGGLAAGLDLVAAALAAGEPAPEQAIALMAQPFIPGRAYTLMGNFGWLMEARRHRALTRLGERPFRQA